MKKFLPAMAAAAMLLFPATAFAWPQPPPSLNQSRSEIVIDNETATGAWMTLYKDVKAGPIPTGKRQIVRAYCAEPRRVTTQVILIDVDLVRAEVTPGCRGKVELDRSHGTHSWGLSAPRGNTGGTFRRFDGRIYVASGAFHFVDVTK